MAGPDDIVQNVVLAGQTDVTAAFAAIEEAGVRAFAAIEQAATASSFTAFVTTLTAVTTAVAGISVAFFELAKKTSEATDSQAKLATQAGVSLDVFSTFGQVLARSGTGVDSLGVAFKRLSVQIEAQWPVIRKSVQDNADLMKSDLLSVEKATNSLESAQIALAQLRQDPTAQAARGEPIMSTPQVTIDAQNQELATLKLKDAENAVKEAVLARSAAQKKADEDARNDVTQLAKYVDDLAKGQVDLGLKLNKTPENLFKGLLLAAGPAVEQLQNFDGSLSDVASSAPKVFDVLLKLADVFKNSGDATLNTALAFRVFGRGVTQDFIRSLSQGSAEILKQQKKLDDLGFSLKGLDAPAHEFHVAFATLFSDVDIVGKQIGALFQPAFSELLKTLTILLEGNRQKIVDWGASIRDQAQPYLDSIIRVLQGAPDKIKDDWLLSLIDDFKGVGKAIGEIVGVIVPVFTTIKESFDDVAKQINSVFGTDLHGTELLVIAWAASIAAQFGIVQSAIRLASSAVLLLVGNLKTLALWLLPVIALIELYRDFNHQADDAEKKTAAFAKSLIDLNKQFESGAISQEEFTRRYEAMRAEFEKFRQGSSDAATGVKDDLGKVTTAAKDTGDQSSAALNKIPAAAKDAADGVTKSVDIIRNGITKAYQVPVEKSPLSGLADDAKTSADAVTASVEIIKNGIKTIVKVPKEQSLTDALLGTDAKSATAQVEATVTVLQNGIAKVFKVPAELGSDTIANAIKSFEDELAKLDGAYSKSKDSTDEFTTGFVAVGTDIEDVAVKVTDAAKVITDSAGTIKMPSAEVLGTKVLNDFFDGLPGKAADAWQQINDRWNKSPVSAEVVGTTQINQAFDDMATQIGTSIAGIGTKAKEVWDEVNKNWNKSPISAEVVGQNQVNQAFDDMAAKAVTKSGEIFSALAKAWQDINAEWTMSPVSADVVGTTQINQAFDDLVVKAQQTWDRMAAIFRNPLPSPLGGGGGGFDASGNPTGVAGFAEGGLLRGRPGRDANLAWFTDLEYVFRPEAVRHWGVGFLESLNNLKMPSIPGFATGGLNRVSAAAPSSGMASRGLVLDFSKLGGPVVSGLRGPTGTIDALERDSAFSKLVSTGKQPGWRGR